LIVAGFAAWAQGGEFTAERFLDPPMEARPTAFWDWLNGNVDIKTLTSDLEQARQKGMGGLEIWDVGALSNGGLIPAGPEFLSDESVAAIHHSLKEGKRLGMRMSMIASSGWNAGGTWVTPDWGVKHLYFSTHELKGPAEVNVALPFPKVSKECPKGTNGLPVFFKEVAVLAVPNNTEKRLAGMKNIIDLTGNCKDGKLVWNAPAGDWVILRFVCANSGQRLIAASPKSEGLFIDFLEPSATERHFKYILDRLGLTQANAVDSGLFGLEVDSMEMGRGIQWTDRFSEYFKHWCGYDPTRYLPILAGWKVEGVTDAFMYDYRKAVSEQLIFSHYTTGRDFLRRYGLKLIAEAGGPGYPISPTPDSAPVDALKALGNVDVPRGEFWIQHMNIFLVKEVASAAHIYGLKINESEAFTTWRRWKDSPFTMKQLADRAMCEGLNHFNFHTFAHSSEEAGLPGRAYHAGSDINPRVTWWNQARPFMDYLGRCSYLLQQGDFVADVCGYYGDQAPNFWPLVHNVPVKPLYPGLEAGYDYDVINSDIIQNRMSVKGGRIVLESGMTYRLLVLPKQDHIPVEVLEKVVALVKDGAVVLGPKPERDPRLGDQPRRTDRVRKLADELWGGTPEELAKGRKVRKGRVFDGITPTQALTELGVGPDFGFKTATGLPVLDFIHRRTDASDLYFVRNTGLNQGTVTCRFRVKDRTPELWDPVTGRRGIAVACRPDGDFTEVDLPMASGGSMFVVFRKGEGEKPQYRVAKAVAGPAVAGPWALRFPNGWGAPAEVTMTNLHSWTEFAEHDTRYFSGTAEYETGLEISAEMLADGGRVFVDLGDVREVAEVLLNDKPLGIAWQPPFRVELTTAGKAGANRLKVRVTNLWINRLYGDHTTKGVRYTRTNSTFGRGASKLEALPSGLLGPVRLVMVPSGEQGNAAGAVAELLVIVGQF
jgi:hypothetical protein